MKNIMKRLTLSAVTLLCLGSLTAFASSAVIRLENAHANSNDQASVMRGAKFFAVNCMSCHTMRYLAHNKLAEEAGVVLDKMPLEQKEWWLGAVPPDLTLLGRTRSANWIYTYFHSFYKDPDRPSGYNNLLVEDINMPNIFAGLQGEQTLTRRGFELLEDHGTEKPHYYSILKLEKSGSMSAEEFNNTATDLVNFFLYAADPNKLHREHLGVFVILFLFVLFILAFLLKRAYWKDVPKNKAD